MALTLAEKHGFSVSRPSCDMETPTVAASAEGHADEPTDVHLESLLAATLALVAVTMLLWLSSRAAKWSFRQLLRKWSGRYGRGRTQDSEDDGSATVFGSPLTPPPNFWLHDTDPANPASYTTPHPEPLLFSLSPGPHGGAGGGAAAPPYSSHHLRTMGSAAGEHHQALAGGRGSPALLHGSPLARAARMYGSPPDGGSDPLQLHHHQQQHHQHFCRRSPGGSSGGRAGASSGGTPLGWDRGLLSRQAALLPAISSVEGLMASADFQEHVRSTRGRSPFLEREQSQAKVQLYKDLRRLDPDAFRRLLTRDDIRTYGVRPPSLVFAVADYVVGVLAVPLALAALMLHHHHHRSGEASAAAGAGAAGSSLLLHGVLCLWLVVRLRLAAAGHVSLLGRTAGAYLVYDTSEDEAAPGNAWEGLVGVGGHLLLDLFEVLMAGLSCGLLAVGALASIAAGQRRQTLAMRLLGLRLELETARQTRLSPFSPSSDNAAGIPSNTKASSQRSFESLPGRYGLSHR